MKATQWRLSYQFQNFISGPSALFSPEEQKRRRPAVRWTKEGLILLNLSMNILCLEIACLVSIKQFSHTLKLINYMMCSDGVRAHTHHTTWASLSALSTKITSRPAGNMASAAGFPTGCCCCVLSMCCVSAVCVSSQREHSRHTKHNNTCQQQEELLTKSVKNHERPSVIFLVTVTRNWSEKEWGLKHHFHAFC